MRFEMTENWMWTLVALFAAGFAAFMVLQIQTCKTAEIRARETCMVECIRTGNDKDWPKSCVRICDTDVKVKHTIRESECIVDCIKADKSPMICEDACTVQ